MKFLHSVLLTFMILSTSAWSTPVLANGQGAYRDGEYPKAFDAFLPLANNGDAESQYYVGLMYAKGQAVPQDAVTAVDWYQKAANQGHPIAQNNLGYMYGQGVGVKRNFVQAHMWYSLAAAAGNILSQENRTLISKKMTSRQITRSQKMAREWMTKFKDTPTQGPNAQGSNTAKQ